MILPYESEIKSLSDTKIIAEKLAKICDSNAIICLNGNLGAGKTQFVKFFAEYFKINQVESPTFAIVNEYNGIKKLNHFDFYRIKNVEELYDLGFHDYLMENAITIIEWSNLFEEILPQQRIEIELEVLNENLRKIKIIEK